MDVQQIINLLNLEPLPKEGGFYRRTYLSQEKIQAEALPQRYRQEAAFGSAIYYLFTTTDFSGMHRLNTDEIFHFYMGDPVEMLLLKPDGSGETFTLGINLNAGMRPQKVVEKGVWQGACVTSKGQHGYSLIGTTMAPGFDWESFELGVGDELIKQYPHFTDLIKKRHH